MDATLVSDQTVGTSETGGVGPCLDVPSLRERMSPCAPKPHKVLGRGVPARLDSRQGFRGFSQTRKSPPPFVDTEGGVLCVRG